MQVCICFIFIVSPVRKPPQHRHLSAAHWVAARGLLRWLLLLLAAMWELAEPRRLVAVTLYWDADGSTSGNQVGGGAGLGGSGLWDLNAANWWTGSLLGSWPNGDEDRAIFTAPLSSDAYSITLGSGIRANSMSFLRSGFTLSGGDLTLVGVSPMLQVNFAELGSLNSQLKGVDGFTLAGGGMMKLGNAANSITGPISIQSGTLVISAGSALGPDNSAVVVNGSATRGVSGGSLLLDGTAGSVVLGRDLLLKGLGPVADRGAALVSLGNNSLTGLVKMAEPTSGTSINTRISAVEGTLSLAATSTLTVQGTAASTLSIFGGTNQAGVPLYNLTGTLTGTGTLEKSGAGTLLLNPTDVSAFSGTIRVTSNSVTLTQGGVRITNPGVIGSRTATGADSVIDLNAGFLEVRMNTPTLQTTGGSNANVYSRSSTTASTFFLDHAPGSDSINATLTLGAYGYAAAADITFSSRNGYGFTFGAAPVVTGDGDPTVTNNSAGTLTFTGAFWSNGNSVSRTMTIQGTGSTLISGAITASHASVNHNLLKTGTGLLSINNQSATLDGTVSVQGPMAIRDIRAIGAAGNLENIILGNTTGTAGSLIFGTQSAPTAANLTTSRPIVLNTATANNAIYASQSGTTGLTLNGAITMPNTTTASLILGGSNTANNSITVGIPAGGGASPSNGLIKQGSGTWRLSGVNAYPGATTITAGVLKLAANAASSTIIGEAAGNTLVFNVDSTTQNAGGVLEFIGVSGSATTEALGALTPTAGSGTVRLTSGGAGAAANLSFTSLGTVAKASGINFDLTGSGGGSVTLTGLATTTATTLPGNGHLYVNGNHFAVSSSGVIGTPNYTAGGTEFNDAGGANALIASRHNQLSSVLSTAPDAIQVTSLRLGADLTMASGATLTVNTGATANDGGILAYADATIASSGAGGVTTGGAGTLVYQVPSGVTLTQNAPVLSGTTGGLTKNGAGVLVFGATNAQTGATTLNEGVIRLTAGAALSGSSTTTDLAIRQGATFDLNGVSSTTAIRSLNGSGSIVNGMSPSTPATATLQVGNNTGTGVFTGLISNGSGGALSLTKVGTGAMSWLGSSTYTGVTTIGSTGLVTVNVLANGGSPSGIGQSSAAASNLVFNGSTGGLVYAGGLLNGSLSVGSVSTSTDRLFTLAASATGATLSSTVGLGNAVVWSATGPIVNLTTAAATLILTGTSTGDNTFNPQLINSSATGTPALGLSKTGTGQWNLGNSANTYSGPTNIADGILGINGTGALSPNSPLTFSAGALATTGILQMSGTFERSLAASAVNGTPSVTWASTSTGSGGFAANAADLLVALGGVSNPTALTWGVGGFVGSTGTQNLSLSSTSALASVDFRNPINFNGALRGVSVADNTSTGMDFAVLSGVLSGTGASGLQKLGPGVLKLTAANSYSGITDVAAGTLIVSSLGSSTGAATSSLGASGVAMSNSNALQLSSATGTSVVLQYVGSGETSDRKIRLNSTTGGAQIHADGSGPLILTNVANDSTTTGAKTLSLRGSNVGGNTIASILSNDGSGGVLSVSVDGGATWILSGANTYSGNTTAGAGPLGVGSSSALGTGTLILNNGAVFAAGADRTLANNVTQNNSTTSAFLGDYSLTFTGNFNNASSANSNALNNYMAEGRVLSFNTMTNNSISADRNFTIQGTGSTTFTGAITTSQAFNLNLQHSSTGTLTLAGAGSNFWNHPVNAGNITFTAGTLRLGANDVIPNGSGSGANGNLVFNPAAGVTAVFDLNGFSDTINGLTASALGNVVLTNSGFATSTLTLGDIPLSGGGVVNFGGGVGSATIVQTAGVINLAKVGAGTANFTGSLSNTGSTTVNGGVFNYNSPTSSTSFSVGAGASLNFKGGLTLPGSVLSLSLAGGGTLSFASGQGQPLDNLSSLSLGAGTGTATLELDAGDSGTDRLTLASGIATAANTISLLIKDISLSNLSSYTLISAPGGGLTSGGATYSLNLAGYNGSSLTTTDTSVVLNTGTLITSDVYWNGGAGSSAWNAVAGAQNDLTNFSSDEAGSLTVATLPGKGQKVILQADNLSVGGALSTTLEQPFKINALLLRASSTPANTPTSVTIAPGALATNSLTLVPSLASDGISMATGGPALLTISSPLVAQSAQTWTVTDSTQAINLSNALSGSGNVTKAGAGSLTFSAAGSGYSGTFSVAAGSVALTAGTVLSGLVAAPGSGAPIVIQGGSLFYSNATAGTVPNNLTLAGGALSSSGNGATYSGAVLAQAATNSTINLRDGNSALTSAAARNITLSGVVAGSGSITVDSIDTDTAGNQLTGNLVFNNAANTWSGSLNLLRGGVFFQNVAASGSATPYASFDGAINFNQFGRVTYRNLNDAGFTRSRPITLAASALGELSVDNVSSPLGGNFTLNQSAALNLNAGSILRVTLDAGSALNLDGGLVLNGNASFSTQGGTGVSNLVSIGGPGITGTGNLAINDEAGVWAVTSQKVAINVASSFVGDTLLHEGTLILGHRDALSNGTLLINGVSNLQAGVDLSVSGFGPLSNAVTLNNNLTVIGSNSLTLSGALTATNGDVNRSLLNNLTQGTLVLAGNNLAIGASANTAARALTLGGSGNTTVSGSLVNGNAFANALIKAGTGSVTLSGINSYTGATSIDQGALILAVDSSFSGPLNFGSASATTTVGTLDLSAANATFSSLVAQTNSNTASSLIIGAGKTLKIEGNVSFGVAATGSTTTVLNASGGGTLLVQNSASPPTSFAVGGASTGTGNGNKAFVDLSGLGEFNVALNTSSGVFRVAPFSATNVADRYSILTLPATGAGLTTITAATLSVGDGGHNNNSSGQINQLRLGTGVNTLRVNTVNIGTGSRDMGSVTFQAASGSLVLRAADGLGRAAFNLGTGIASTGVAAIAPNTFDVTGHDVDLLIGNLNIGGQNRNTDRTDIFAMDRGSLDASSVLIGAVGGAANAAAANNTWTSTLNLAGGSVVIGTGGLDIARASTAVTGSDVLAGNLNLSDSASVTVANNPSFGAAIRMANNSIATGLTANATINLNGGLLFVTGHILKGDSTGASSAQINLAGGTLNLNGNAIGTQSNLVNLSAQSGTLRNVGELNGGGPLNKTSQGSLLLDTANSYSGLTQILEGVLLVAHGSALGSTTAGTSVGAGATLSLSSGITVAGEALSLSAGVAGSAVLNNASGNNVWSGDLTINTGDDASARALLNADAGRLTLSGNITLSSGTQDLVLRGNGDGEISGQITGSQRLFKSSVGNGTWTLSGDNSSSFSGRATIGNGTLQISSEANLGATPGTLVSNQLTLGGSTTTGTLKVNGNTALSANRGITVAAGGGALEVTAGSTLTLDSLISGAGTLSKQGDGVLRLTGDNSTSFSGTLNISAGTLEVSNSSGSATGSGSLNLSNSGSRLSGSGNIGGSTVVGSGAVLAPGLGNPDENAGSLGFSASGVALQVLDGGQIQLSLQVSSQIDSGFNWQTQSALSYLSSNNGANYTGLWSSSGPSYDSIRLSNGVFNLGTTSGGVIRLINSASYAPGSIFKLLDWSGAGAGTPLDEGSFDPSSSTNLDFSTALNTGLSWDLSAFNVYGVIVVVPEPSRAVLLMLGLLALLTRRQRS
jgi:autotransporter-associated beta strand protein